MTQLSREQLLEIVETDHVQCGEASAMAKMLLAADAQEPVGEVVLGEYDDCGDYPDAKVVCIAAQGQADWNGFRDGTKLYAAPQPVAVPEQCSDEDDLFQAPPHEFFEAISQSREYCASLSPTVIQRMAKSLAKHLREKPVAVPDELREAANGLLDVLDEYPEQLVPVNRDSAVV